MDFNTAVQNAMQGDSESFAFLYNSTYYNMLYIAMKYVKNQQDAEDIVQDSYIKARMNMNMLKNPEKFNSWLGCIVANTSVNYLKKKKPLIFSAVGGEDHDGESFVYEIQDDNETYQPEQAYSKEEIKSLVREMVDSLSDEQRMCVMMYHFDGQSIRAIADSMGCSENTVKSRLYYGRNALRKKMEKLKAQGYQLYAITPIPFLLYLLKAEKALPETQTIAKDAMDRHANGGRNDGSLRKASKQAANDVVKDSVKETVKETAQQAVEQTGTNAAAEFSATAAQQAGLKVFMGTVTGKVTAAVLAAVILGGTAAGVTIANDGLGGVGGRKFDSDSDTTSSKFKRDSDSDTSSCYNGDLNADVKDSGWHIMNDELYPEKIDGNLSKKQLEFVLARLPDDFNAETDNISNNEYINMFCSDIILSGESHGFTSPTYSMGYTNPDFKVDEVNSIFASFRDFEVTQYNFDIEGGEYLTRDDGDVIIFDVAANNERVNANIFRANYNANKIELSFYCESYDDIREIGAVKEKQAVLKSNENGKYRIVKIEVVNENVDTDNSLSQKEESKPTVSSEESVSSKPDSDKESDTDTASATSSSNTSSEQEQTTVTVIEQHEEDTSSSENENTSRQEESQAEEEQHEQEWTSLNDDEYSSKIRGGLNKEQLELVLGRVDNSYCNNITANNDYILINYFSNDMHRNSRGLYIGYDDKWKTVVHVSEMDMLFSSFSDYKVSESNPQGMEIEGDNIKFFPAETGDNVTVTINEAKFKEDEMIIEYRYVYEHQTNNVYTDENRRATLKNDGDGYHIVDVTAI